MMSDATFTLDLARAQIADRQREAARMRLINQLRRNRYSA
jgi:hypothetical protein